MLGLIYIILCVALGAGITFSCFPNLMRFGRLTYRGKEIHLSPAFVCLPAWFLFGTIPTTWLTYLLGYLFRDRRHPLYPANMIVMPLIAFIASLLLSNAFLKRKEDGNPGEDGPKGFKKLFAGLTTGEATLFACITAFCTFLMFWTFFYINGNYYVGWTVQSDFSPHIGMIRSFAVGNNFPTQYSHFAGEDIKYHFLFQFFVGNLNYLGMRLDLAFNIPSIVCLLFVYSLLYFYAVKLSGKRAVGVITTILFSFRSSRAFFDFAGSIPKKTGLLKGLLYNFTFIGTTQHEDWGLWNLNVYCNQRHLALGLCVVLFLLIYFTKFLFEGTGRSAAEAKERLYQFLQENPGEELLPGENAEYCTRASLFRRDGWYKAGTPAIIACGLLLGLTSFFNGACVIGCLAVLFVMAFASDNRLSFALTAAITVVLASLSAKFFINGNAIKPKYQFGFLAEQQTLSSVIKYLGALLGVLPIAVFVSLMFIKGTERFLTLAFTAPIVVAFTLSLTPDIAVNHKYVMIGVMLLDIPVAALVCRLWEYRGAYAKALCCALVFCLIITGLYDFTTVVKKNASFAGYTSRISENSDICRFVMEHSDSKDIWLTDWYSLNDYVLGGAMLYFGWPYYAWSAGYQTTEREPSVYAMYTAQTPEELRELVKKHGIRFIVLDDDIRAREELQVEGQSIINEQNIINTFGLVFNNGETQIFDTRIAAGAWIEDEEGEK